MEDHIKREMVRIGTLIKNKREALNKKHEELALVCGVRPADVIKWETGLDLPAPSLLLILCTVFKVDKDYFDKYPNYNFSNEIDALTRQETSKIRTSKRE